MIRPLLAALLLGLAVPTLAQQPDAAPAAEEKPMALRLETTTTLRGPPGPWGAPVADERNRRLYLPRGPAGLSVVSLDTLKPVAEIADTAGSAAVALDPETLRGFSANALESTPGGPGSGITVFDQRSLKPVGNVAVAASRVFYDVATRQLVAAGTAGELALIDPVKLSVITTLKLDGTQPSALAADRRGRVFVALADRDAIAVIDMVARTVATTWKPQGCRAPVGLVFDQFGRRLIVACRGKAAQGTIAATPATALMLDVFTGHPAANFQVPQALDAVIHDAQNRMLYFTSGTTASVLVYRQLAPYRYQALEAAGTRPMAGQGVADGRTGRLILVSAEYVVLSARADGGGLRILPDSYTLLAMRRVELE